MINVACLDSQYFDAILAGRKRTEERIRKRPDSRLENIRPGELVILLERRTTRTLVAPIRAVKRFGVPGRYSYRIRLGTPTLTRSNRPHLQGWQRISNATA